MDAVDEALLAAPRRQFLPPRERRRATHDGPLPIGHGQTNSQPRTVAAMLRLLAVRPGDRVLDVGTGSAWTTALLAHLAGPEGLVIGTEIVADLCDLGRANLAAHGVDGAPATIEAADPDSVGWAPAAPYDRILVSAQGPTIPPALLDQLGPEGRMVLPVDGTMLLVRRGPAGDEVTEHGHYRFVPLL